MNPNLLIKKCLDIKKGFVSLHHTTRVLLNRHKIGCLMSFQLKDGFFKPKTLYYDKCISGNEPQP